MGVTTLQIIQGHSVFHMLSSVSELAHTHQGTSKQTMSLQPYRSLLLVLYEAGNLLTVLTGAPKLATLGMNCQHAAPGGKEEGFHQRGLSHSRRAGHAYNLARALRGLAQTAVQLANSASRPTVQTSGAASGSYVCLMTQHPHPTCRAMPPERPSYTMPGRLPGASATHRHASRGIRWHGAPPHAFDEITASRVPWP
jgi:hypothetical protein